MNSRQVGANLMVAILVLGAISALGISFPAQNAAAQDVTIKTSADTHGKAFFGESYLQVIVTDPDADDDDNIETLQVDIDATVTEDATTSSSGSFTVYETSKSSGKFEFYLAPGGADDVAPADLDTVSSSAADEYPTADVPQVIRFGDVGDFAEVDLDTGSAVNQEVEFEINVGDTTVDANYEPTSGQVSLDRESGAYGGSSIVHLFINDQDANLDPTNRDTITFTADELNDALFAITGATFNDDDDVDFVEDGDNSAMFEAKFQLVQAADDDQEELIWTDDSVQITLNDQSVYTDLDDAENDQSDDTDSVDLTISDEDGDISTPGEISFASELKVTVTDNDQNLDSDIEDTIEDGLVIETETDVGDGGDMVTVDLDETTKDSGIFEPSPTNNEVKINFVASEDDIDPDNDILELTADTTTDDITMSYTDPLNADDTEETFTQEFSLAIGRPTVTLPETVGVNDDFTVTFADSNLNDNPRTRDTYTITLLGDDVQHPLLKGGDSLEDLATVEVQIESQNPDFADAVTETLTETGINTGIFEASFDMNDIIDSTGVEVDDGDSIEFTLNDFFDDQSHESSDQLSIGKASTGVDFSRTVAPIPPEADSDVAEIMGESVFSTLTITDSDQNLNSNTEDTIPFLFEDDADDGEPAFRVEIDADGNDNDETIASEADYDAGLLSEILPGLMDLSLSETSKTSGVFEDDLEFVHGDTLSTDDWQDLEITFTYIDADSDEEEAGMTFRGNDGVMTVDQDSVKSGSEITVTVQDEDLNLDDTTAEEFDGSISTDSPYLLSVETEDDDVCADTDACPTTETFRETGEDTGIFTATYTVGEDIPVTDQAEDDDQVTQATDILFTYNDEVDASGNDGDEIETTVLVVTSTGTIVVTPELVGPGTELSVTITDADLNKDPSGADNYNPVDFGVDPDSDDFFVNFRSDRNEVQEASPEIEETGANTGVFTFNIQLETDETACENDDLDSDDFDGVANGGSEPSIGACPGDLISIKYEDEQSADGRTTTVSKVVEVKAFDPTFAADKDSYNVGDKVTVSISDPDANRDSDIADTLEDVRVFSDTDAVGEELSALETGKDTGVFKLSFTTSSSTSSGAITVKTGDQVTIEYTDQYPADFEEEENDKDFDFVVDIAGNVGTGATTPTPPSVKDVTGNELNEVSAGQQVVLATTVHNNNDGPQPFAAIVEVRDSSGITVFLAWQTGILNANGQTEVGLSWTPDSPGDYTVRTFVISGLNNPQILSEVKTSSISVS